MQNTENLMPETLAKYIGWSMLISIFIGIVAAFLVARGIDINLSADIKATSENMLDAEQRLRAKAYIALFSFALDAFINVGLFVLLRRSGQLMAAWSLFVSLVASTTILLGAMFAMNAALISSNTAYDVISNDAQRLLLVSLQVTSDYTSFHLGLILATAAKAGFFYLFFKSALIPKIISGWGVFASLFVVITIVARDFMPILGSDTITASFMVSNLLALVSTGLYLGIKGVRGNR
ncbi:MAG: DUF4386 domain-containing protein [Arenicella sp.]|nr:DUF4386 domain-containing protein [Arenicella sp.]